MALKIDRQISTAQEYGYDNSHVDANLGQDTFDHVPDDGIGSLWMKVIQPFAI